VADCRCNLCQTFSSIISFWPQYGQGRTWNPRLVKHSQKWMENTQINLCPLKNAVLITKSLRFTILRICKRTIFTQIWVDLHYLLKSCWSQAASGNVSLPELSPHTSIRNRAMIWWVQPCLSAVTLVVQCASLPDGTKILTDKRNSRAWCSIWPKKWSKGERIGIAKMWTRRG